ncbi:GntR family transcriptional regulator [Aeromicrobium sp. YIM 150415]|uniref:GntR family transcriptional regulator n=1 Tax=Aeromicrobium sp. YIM 150415 TaxID=2803912 RepID=UPI001F069D22|nr:GntR family transcriptional regulator [Aeromicrobium sp. YIM 150415]
MWATKTDAAYGILRAEILDGTLEPGSRMDQEEIARRLGLSTTPLREALRRLEAEGFLRQLAHREMRVPPLTRKEIIDIYDIRLQLDPFAGRLGAQQASAAVREQLAEMRELRTDVPVDEMIRQHRVAHRLMYSAADNVPLTELLDTLWDRAGRYQVIVMSEVAATGIRLEDYRATVDAFVAGNGAEVARLMKASLKESRALLADRLSD